MLDDGAWEQVPRGPFTRGSRFNNVFFATMTNYESSLQVSGVAFDKPKPMSGILGDILSKEGLTQLRCAETEKFPHVTFFFNDYNEDPFEGGRVECRCQDGVIMSSGAVVRHREGALASG